MKCGREPLPIVNRVILSAPEVLTTNPSPQVGGLRRPGAPERAISCPAKIGSSVSQTDDGLLSCAQQSCLSAGSLCTAERVGNYWLLHLTVELDLEAPGGAGADDGGEHAGIAGRAAGPDRRRRGRHADLQPRVRRVARARRARPRREQREQQHHPGHSARMGIGPASSVFSRSVPPSRNPARAARAITNGANSPAQRETQARVPNWQPVARCGCSTGGALPKSASRRLPHCYLLCCRCTIWLPSASEASRRSSRSHRAQRASMSRGITCQGSQA